MKDTRFAKIFFGTVVFTITSFAFAGYSYKRAQIANPEVLTQVAKHYNVAISDSNSGFYIISDDEGNYEKSEKTWDLDGKASAMTISTKAADVTLKASADDKYHVHATGRINSEKNKDLFDVDLQGTEIFISDEGKKTKHVTLEVQVPTQKLKVLRASSISGDFALQGTAADELHVVGVSGNLKFDGTNTKYIEAKSTSGDIQIDNKVPATIEAKSVSGNVKVKSPGMADAGFALHSVSGEIRNPFGSKNSGKTKISVSTTSGDIEITPSKSQ